MTITPSGEESQSSPLRSLPNAARRLGISDFHLRRLVRAGNGPVTVDIGTGRFLFTDSDLDSWVESRKTPSKKSN